MKKKYISLLIITLLLTGGFCFAGGSLELTYPTIGGQTLTVNTDLPHLVKYIFDFSIAISGILAFIVLTIAGVSYMLATGNPGKMSDSLDRIFQAFVGLIILLCAWIILTTINPDLVNISMPSTESQTTTNTAQ